MFSLRSQRTISFLAFVIISITMITLVVRSAREDHDMKKEQAGYVAEIKMNELKNCFENCISSTEIMGTFLESEESVSYSHFETLSNHIYHHYDYVTALILAPDGVADDAYPDINDLSEKTDFLSDSRFSKDAEYAKKYRVATVTGPIRYNDDENVYVILQPIYRNIDNARSFWGFFAMSIDMDKVLSHIKVQELEHQDYAFVMRKDASAYSSATVVAYSGHLKDEYLTYPAELSNGDVYKLSIAPANGWYDAGGITGQVMLGLGLALLLTLVLYSVLRTLWMSNHDNLTGALNMRSYYRKLKRLQSLHSSYGILYLDLNDFKHVNDTYGHAAGDRLLVVSARRMYEAMRRPADGNLERESVYGVVDRTKYRGVFGRVYRLGGDEFSMIIPGNYSDEEFERIMKRIVRYVNHHVSVGNNQIPVSTSIGYAKTSASARDYSEVIKAADHMMYENKQEYKKKHHTSRG